jgi:hypothetical protein
LRTTVAALLGLVSDARPHPSAMGLALAIWLCMVPVILLVVAPRVDLWTTSAVAIATFCVVAIACRIAWGLGGPGHCEAERRHGPTSRP